MDDFLPPAGHHGQHVGLEAADVGQTPGHPEIVHLVIDHHGDGGGGADHDDDGQKDVGVHGCPLEYENKICIYYLSIVINELIVTCKMQSMLSKSASSPLYFPYTEESSLTTHFFWEQGFGNSAFTLREDSILAFGT